ncbi:hypothetical protein LJC07_06560 [Christensenellaceae bacterium OttesenSCG-928-L17]|nr:hypothetical protein [Christensenellaceae bacterium OttesenSCG-928-L17]
MIDTIELEIEVSTQLHEQNFTHGATINTKTITDKSDNSIPHKQTSILASWPNDLRQWELPEVRFVDYPHPINPMGRCWAYQIKLSIPKLLFGNNLQEVCERDFTRVVDKLYEVLVFLELPIEITKKQLINARVRRIDYGKNILFKNATTMSDLNELLRLAEHSKATKTGQIHYRQSKGEMFRMGIQNRVFIIYDKAAEMKENLKKAKPAFDEEFSHYGKIVEQFEKRPELNCIRLELQIGTSKQLKTELERRRFNKEDISFRAMFNDTIAIDLLNFYYDKLLNAVPSGKKVGLNAISASISFNQIARKVDGKRPQNSFAKFGFKTLTGLCGMNRVRSLYEAHFRSDGWSRMKNKLTITLDGESDFGLMDEVKERLNNGQILDVTEVLDYEK